MGVMYMGRRRRDKDATYDPNVDYDQLEIHTYSDTGSHIWYTCPRCGGEYLADFITEENGQTMCIDCWSSLFGDR